MTGGVRTAVILAAGMGTRLREELDDRPKGLLELGDRPIVEESVLRLADAGIERVVLVTGYMREVYEELSRRFPALVVTTHNEVYDRSGSMYSLYCAREHLERDFLLLESDLIYDPSVMTQLIQSPNRNVALVDRFRFGMDGTAVAVENGIITQVIPPHLQG